MKRYGNGTAWLAIVLLLTAACGFTAPRVRYFEVRPTIIDRQAGPFLPAIQVPDFDCVSTYDQVRIVVRRSPVEVVTSRNLQWTTGPGRMLAQGLRERLEATGRFEAVSRTPTRRPRYAIDGLVQVIELDEAPTWTARLALEATLRRTDGEVLLVSRVEESQNAAGRTPADGVLALRALYSRFLDGLTQKIIAAIEQDLRRRGAADGGTTSRPAGLPVRPASTAVALTPA
jgi:uncharacterized lipoprotein YmbA